MDLYLHLQELAKEAGCIKGRPCAAVLSAMREGGVDIAGIGIANRPLLSLLPRLGIGIRTVRDRRRPEDAVLSLIRRAGAEGIFGEGYLDDLTAPVILRTPSLRPDHPALLSAAARGALVFTEAALLCALAPCHLFSVTGSDGKTTTAMLTAHLLSSSGRRTFLGGNIGKPLLSEILEMQREDAAVLELSSFQLSDMEPPHGRAAITNITENHLDWHRDMEEYIAAKANLLGGGTAVLSADCTPLLPLARGRDAILFTERDAPPTEHSLFLDRGTVYLRRDGKTSPLFREEDLTIRGRHNLKNAMAAVALVLDHVPRETIAPALATFRGASHRAEYVGTYRGVACFDSSIDTTPARTAATLSAFRRPLVLLGGRGKKLSMRPLAEALLAGASAAVLSGETADGMEEAIRALDKDGLFPLYRCRDFRSAVLLGHKKAGELGCDLLLSPAATSFDSFPDYAARGRAFAEILRELGPDQDLK